MSLRILALIPARGGSKGVPRKNIRPLGNRPLIYYTLDSVAAVIGLSDTLVSTDDEEIRDVVNQYDPRWDLAPFLRPSELAADKAPTLPVIQHVLDMLRSQGRDYDAVALFQPTVPFRSANLINEAINKLQQEDLDAVFSAREVPHQYNPAWVFTPREDGTLSIATGAPELITRRQELPPAYYRDGALYLSRTEVIRSGSLYGNRYSFVLNKDEPHFNIDTMGDWEQMEKYFIQNPHDGRDHGH